MTMQEIPVAGPDPKKFIEERASSIRETAGNEPAVNTQSGGKVFGRLVRESGADVYRRYDSFDAYATVLLEIFAAE